MKLVIYALAWAGLLAASAAGAPAPQADPGLCTNSCVPATKVCTNICAPATCNAKQTNYGGDLMVLSFGSLYSKDEGQNPVASDPAACCQACRDADGCNTWTFCNDKNGCGPAGACTAYVNKIKGNSTVSADEDKLPILNFGPFNDRCTTDGKFPYLMCSLKINANTAKPVVDGTGAAAGGFIGGVSARKPVKPGCPEWASAATCQACIGTKDVDGCFKCVRAHQYPFSFPDIKSYCSSCANLTDASARSTCYSCGSKYGPFNKCGSCVIMQAAPASSSANISATTACFKCVAKAQAYNSTICSSCYGNGVDGKPVDFDRCNQCVTDSSLSLAARGGCNSCSDNKVPASNRKNCLTCLKQSGISNPAQATGCGGCAVTPNLISSGAGKTCYTCVAQVPSMGWLCGLLDNAQGEPIPAKQVPNVPLYYDCLAALGRRDSGPTNCQGCLQAPAGSVAPCMKCVKSMMTSSNRTAQANALWCNSCYKNGTTSASQKKCEACLLTATDGYECVKGL